VKRTVFKADVLLLLVAAIWGTGFVAQRLGMEHVGPMTFNGIRFAIGTLVLLGVIMVRRRLARRSPAAGDAPTTRTHLLGGLLVGVALFVAASLQQIGLIWTTAGKAGFITGLYVVFVPIIGLFVRHRVHATTWAGAGLAAVGLYFLSVTESFEVDRGDRFVLACAVVWAVHLLLIGRFSPTSDPLELAALQFAVGAALSLAAALLFEDPEAASIYAARWAILYAAVFPVSMAFTLQVVAQRVAPPAHAAILLSFEAVFAALGGWLVLNEYLAPRQLLGCLLMLAGILVTQARTRE
jgi:drug/metabolite transporter (DMT)-like permease